MLFRNTLTEAFDLGFKSYLAKSDSLRQSQLQDFATFYFNDYNGIEDILKRELLNNPFAKETLAKIRIQHIDIIGKTLNRLSGGIYKNRAIREFFYDVETAKTKAENSDLENLLNLIKYNQTVKETFRRALYFNVTLVQPVFDEGKIRLDIINPNDIKVKTGIDYNKIESITIRKSDSEGNLYFSVWTAESHYIEQGGKIIAPKDNEEMINPYEKIPISVLRIKEGIDFYGEPNWNLFLNQKYIDMRLTDLDKSEMEHIVNAWLSINTGLQDGDTIGASKIIKVDGVTNEDVPPSLESISSNVDYVSIRENIDWKIQTMYASEGLSAGSGSTDVSELSGISKLIDENELLERREDFKEILFDFEIDLLNNIRMVNNFYSDKKINNKAVFNVTFSEEKPMESVSDVVARREMETAIGYKNAITFTMEDLELSEEDAINLLKKIKTQNAQLQNDNPGADTDNNSDNDTEDENETE